jgi:Domain of unknown function (DUF1707)
MPMISNTRTRASDADRDRTVAALREHLAAGRLTLEEFEERMDKACAAKTLGELDSLMADLPGADLSQLPDASVDHSAGSPPLTRRRPPGSIEAGRGRFSPAWRTAGGAWLAISLVLFVIWLASGASGGLWFLWVALALGAVLLVRRMTGAPARSERRSARPRRNRRHRDDDQ